MACYKFFFRNSVKSSIKIILLLACVFSLSCSIVLAEENTSEEDDKTTAFGLGYPYLSFKYKAVEVKYASESGVEALGLRINFNLKKSDSHIIYAGIEGDNLTFNTEGLKGSGTVIMPYLGSGFPISENMLFCIDIGPGNITIKETEISNESMSGIEWIANTGIWIYF